MQVYSIATNTWTSFNDVDETQWRSDNAGFASDGLAYFVGGYNATYGFLGSVFAVDAAATLAGGSVVTVPKSPLLFPRGDLTAVASTDNSYAVVTGGFGEVQGFCAPLTDAERYDFVSDQWTEIAPLNNGRGDKALVVFKNHFFALGGERQIIDICKLADEPEVGEKTIAVDDIEVYHAETNSWDTLLDLPNHRFRFAAAAFDDLDSIFAFGGQKGYDKSCACFRATDEVYVFAEGVGEESPFTSRAFSTLQTVVACFLAVLVALC